MNFDTPNKEYGKEDLDFDYYFNGEKVRNVKAEQIINFFKTLQEEKKNDPLIEKYPSRRFIIFIDDLSSFYCIFQKNLYCLSVFGEGADSIKKITTNCFEFRDLYSVSNSLTIKDFYSGAEKDDELNVYCNWIFNRLKEIRLDQIDWSCTYGDKKKFEASHKSLVKELKETIEPQFPQSIDLYEILCKQQSSVGFLWANSLYTEQKIKDQVYYIDKKSFFPFFFVSQKFPSTPFKEIANPNISMIEKYVGRGKAVEFEIEIKEIPKAKFYYGVPNFSNYFFKNSKTNDYSFFGNEVRFGFIKAFCEDLEVVKVKKLYVADKDYLPRSLTDCLIELYNEKEEKEQGSPEQIRAKRTLNSFVSLGGKRIFYPSSLKCEEGRIIDSKENFIESCQFCEKNYQQILSKEAKKRFLLPQWSTRIYSYAQFNLMKSCYKLLKCGCIILYVDTDSIHFINRTHSFLDTGLDVIKQDDLDAIKALERNGYGSIKKLGSWKIEIIFNELVIFGKKTYFGRSKDGEVKCAFAGAKTDAVKEFFEKNKEIEDPRNLVIPARFKPKTIIKRDLKAMKISFFYGDYSLNSVDKEIRKFIDADTPAYCANRQFI